MLAAFLADLDVIVKSEDVVVFLALEIVVSDKLLVFGCASSVEFNFGLILPCSSISCKSVKTWFNHDITLLCPSYKWFYHTLQ